MDPVPSRLRRVLKTKDAVFVGLGAMIGAGIFSAVGPATEVAGNWVPVSLLIAAIIAYLNANSIARLAALYPESGGVYVYGNRRLGPFWGFLAGWAFIIGKLASCAAMAMTFAHYATPEHPRVAAVLITAVLTLVNCFGIEKTVLLTKGILAVVLTSLGFVVAAALSGDLDFARVYPLTPTTPVAVLQAAGFLFFAFAGYARIATLGEEVRDPSETLPRAITISLFATFVLYAAVIGAALLAVDTETLASSAAPLTLVVESSPWRTFFPVVRFGAGAAAAGVLLSLLAGIGRTSFAMASTGDFPRVLSRVHPRTRVPIAAEVTAGAVIAAVTAMTDLRGAIGFSSFAILIYYGIANAAALSLPTTGRRKRLLPALGLLGCATVAVSLPLASTTGGLAVLAVGAAVYAVKIRSTL